MRRRTGWLLLASAITVVGCGPSLTAPTGLSTAYVPTSGLDAYNKSTGSSLMPTGMLPSHDGGWKGGGGMGDGWKGGDWKGGDWKHGGGHHAPFPPIFDPFFSPGFFPSFPYLPPAITFGYGLPYPAYQWAAYPGPILPPIGGPILPPIGGPIGFPSPLGCGVGGLGATLGFGGLGAGLGCGPVGGVGAPIGQPGLPIGQPGVPVGQPGAGNGGQPMPVEPDGGIGNSPIPGWPGTGGGNGGSAQIQQSIANEFNQMDANKDQWLTQQEYVNGKMAQIRWVQQPSQQQMTQMQQQFLQDFQKSDADRNGHVSLQEFANAPIYTIQQGGGQQQAGLIHPGQPVYGSTNPLQ